MKELRLATRHRDEKNTKRNVITFEVVGRSFGGKMYSWDSMDDQDQMDSETNLSQTDKWIIWKTKDNLYSVYSLTIEPVMMNTITPYEEEFYKNDGDQKILFFLDRVSKL